MHAFIVGDGDRGVRFLFEAWILVDLKRARNSTITLIPYKTLLKNQWCIPLHVLYSSVLFAVFVDYDVKFFNRRLVHPIQFQMHLDNFPRLFRNHVVELTSKVL